MVISNKNKYIFISNPKTATTSIQKFLLKHDRSSSQNKTTIGGKKYTFREHYTAIQIKDILREKYEDYTVFGFIRNPYSKLVSSYHFYKNGESVTKKGKIKRIIPNRIKILSTKILSYKTWSLIYPYKSNIEYYTDHDGKIIVNWLGIYEDIDESLKYILGNIGVPKVGAELPFENSSSHKTYEKYVGSSFIDALIRKKLSEDIEFYEYVNSNREKDFREDEAFCA